jgi:hypothetical protein
MIKYNSDQNFADQNIELFIWNMKFSHLENSSIVTIGKSFPQGQSYLNLVHYISSTAESNWKNDWKNFIKLSCIHFFFTISLEINSTRVNPNEIWHYFKMAH